MGNVAIHGFGRIGRTLLRIGLERQLFNATAISDIKDIPTLAALFSVDSNYGRWREPVDATETGFSIGDRSIRYFDAMKELPPWGELGVDACGRRGPSRRRRQARAGERPEQDAGRL